MIESPEFWVAVAFVILVAGAGRTIWRRVAGALDGRAEAIKGELEEAQRLREEAQHLLAEFQRKQRQAVEEAEGIVAHAEEEAERLRQRAARNLEAAVARREQQAKDRIAQAEAQALADVRAVAVDAAIGAARRLIADSLDAKRGGALIDDAIKELPDKLH